MAIFDLFRRPQPLTEVAQPDMSLAVELLQERLAELELALEDAGWEQASGQFDREFTREGLRKIISLSRLSALKNPVIQRAVTLQAMYVWGQGVSISARDDSLQELVQGFLDDPDNQAELTTHQQRTLKEIELQVTGNLFFVLFPSRDGLKVRTIDVEEIDDILCNPEDRKQPWFYRRTYLDAKGQPATRYYPDWRLKERPPLPERVTDEQVAWDSPVYHVKVGGYSSMRFGVPETYAALDWARAYKEFLEDWATLVRSLSRFAWRMTVKGGSRGVAASKTKLQTTLGEGGSAETNPSPVVGSVFVGAEGNDLTPMPKSGATVAAEDGRRLLLMVAAAMGLPETFFGDASVGSLATAKSLDRPTELKFLNRQSLWRDIFTNLLNYAIDRQTADPMGVTVEVDRTIDIEFPPLLAHDISEAVASVVSAITLDGKTPARIFDLRTIIRWLARAIGEDDVDELLEALAPEEGEPTAVPFGEEPEDDGFMEVVRAIRESVRE